MNDLEKVFIGASMGGSYAAKSTFGQRDTVFLPQWIKHARVKYAYFKVGYDVYSGAPGARYS